MMKEFEFKDCYCKMCDYRTLDDDTNSNCCYEGRNGCTCIYENAFDDMKYFTKAIGYARERRDDILDALCEEVENIKFYAKRIEEAQELITKMRAIDEVYGKL